MKKILFLLILFVTSVSALHAIDLQHSTIFSFTHFICGNSGLFPRGCSLNPFIWKARSGNELAENPVFSKVAALTRKAAESFNDPHRFECALYKAGLAASDIAALADFISQRTGEKKEMCLKLLNPLYEDFIRYFYPNKALIETELIALKKSESFKHFSNLLEQQKAAFSCKAADLDLKIAVIPVFATSEEFSRLRDSGKFSIFGLSLDEIQLIELPIIPGLPEITSRASVHLNAVALHEINHFLYYDSDFFKAATEFFSASKYSNARLAGSYFSETLATACGQGMAHLVYKTEDPQWYDNRIINRLAHDFFGTAREYLEQGKQFDAAFLQSYLEVFRKAFPDARLIPEIALTRFALHFPGIGDDEAYSAEFKNTLKKYLPNFRTVDYSAADAETLAVEVFVKDGTDNEKVRRSLNNNLLFKTLAEQKKAFMTHRAGSESRPARLTIFLDSVKDLTMALSALFKHEAFKPIMRL
ncbi:MAG TPA: hypothetical protein DCG57_15015 [Candidatus Riflebacteria bacterium]|nr:hypothetical protein [Candidatus Riflebacteria bacterium]